MHSTSRLATLAATVLLLAVISPLHAAHAGLISTPTGLRLAQADPSPSINQKRAAQRKPKKPRSGQPPAHEPGDEPISTRVAKSRQAKQKVITTVGQMGQLEHEVKQHTVLQDRIKALRTKKKKQKLSQAEERQLQEAENKVQSFEHDMNRLVDGLEHSWNEVFSQFDVDPDHPLLGQAILTDDNGFMSDQGNAPTCGHHSCRMVLRTQGKLVSAEQLIRQAPLRQNRHGVDVGININDIKGLFTRNGVDAALADYRTLGNHNAVQALKKTLAVSRGPLIVRVKPNQQFRALIEAGDDPSMPASIHRAARIARDRATYSHFVVVEGVVSMQTEQGWQEHFVIRDPQNMTYTHPVSGFEHSFTGEVVFPTGSLSSSAGSTGTTP